MSPTQHPGNRTRVSNFRLWLLLSILPLLALGADFLLYPQLFEHRQLLQAVDATTLTEKRLVHLGATHSAELSVALESLKDEDSLAYLAKSARSGLVISIFVDPEQTGAARVFEGELSRAVRGRLQSLAPGAHERLVEFIEQARQRQPGDVAGLDLQLTKAERARFPVDRVIMVVLKRASSKESAELMDAAMAGVIADAENAGLTAVALPCIGYQWKDHNSLSFDQVFRPVFKALKDSRRPLEVFVSLYSGWPTFAIEDAVAALNHAWTSDAAGSGSLPSLYRGRYRLFLPLLTVCLLACTTRAQNTVKSFMLITAAYVAASTGLAELLEFFTKDYPEQPVRIGLIIMWTVLALGFPVFLRWDVKDVFKRKGAG